MLGNTFLAYTLITVPSGLHGLLEFGMMMSIGITAGSLGLI